MSKKSIKKSLLKQFPLFVEDFKKTGNITASAKKICEDKGIKYTDSVRRILSSLLKERGVQEHSKNTPIELTQEYKDILKNKVKKSKYYLITQAQAETSIHKEFWENVLAYANFLKAEIVVQPSRYKNPTSLEASSRQKDKEKNRNIWATELQPYLQAKDVKLNKYLTYLGSLKVQPTAVNPLSGVQGFTGLSSCIVPHPKVHLEACPVLKDYPEKIMLTTGSVTIPNYTDTKAGKKGEWEHEFGFVVVEIVDSELFYVRQVIAEDSGDFYDLVYKVSNGVVEEDRNEETVVVFGDSHFGQEDSEAHATAVEVAKKLNAKNVVLHDVFNGITINHHELNNPIKQLTSEPLFGSVQEEIEYMLDKIEEVRDNTEANVHIVQSNHDLFLEKWLEKADLKSTPFKSEYIMFLNLLVEDKNSRKGIIKRLIDHRFKGEAVFTYTVDDSFRVKDVELGFHGHLGGNGARGNVNGFRVLNTKTVTAHQHSPKRRGGAVVVGTLTKKDLGYNKGASNWVQGVGVLYPNGKVSHIHIIDGKYTTFKI